MRADTEGLLNKMVEKEEYHLNRYKLNEEEMMRLREQGQFGYEMCAKIEQTLKEYSKDEDGDVSNNFKNIEYNSDQESVDSMVETLDDHQIINP